LTFFSDNFHFSGIRWMVLSVKIFEVMKWWIKSI
jgi:hypothetical protein